MERMPGELCLQIFRLLDHQSLATALQGPFPFTTPHPILQTEKRKWKRLTSDDTLWSDLFEKRWGQAAAVFYAPRDSKSWKDAYIVQDRCDRYGLGLKIIREGSDYYLIHQGEVQRHLGRSKHQIGSMEGVPTKVEGKQESSEILDSILFFIGDLEVANSNSKRARM